ncbi:MAG: acyl-CoA dehydrogenase family protein [Ilumatobacter sp.]
MPDVLHAAEALHDIIAANADASAAGRRLAAPTAEALARADLMRMCVPAEYGGPEVDPPTMLRTIAELARSDGAAGWCAMIASTTSSMAAYLPPPAARRMYGDSEVVTGGVFAPNGRGAVTERDGVAGVSVTGRWAWGSGSQHCDWVMGGVACDDDRFRLAWFERGELDFHDTWHTGGMRGSGSLDFSVDEVFVPLERTIEPGVSAPVVASPITRFSNFTLLAACVGAVGLGIARHALDEVTDVAAAKRPQYSSKSLGEHPHTQIELARAEMRLRGARAFLLAETEAAWAKVEVGQAMTIDDRLGIRMAAVDAAQAGVDVAQTAFTLAGGTAVYDTSPLGRCLRDAHVVTQHIQTAPKLLSTFGRILVGLPTDVSMF